jgi:hypothetical protein
VVALVAAASGTGYYLVASDGGVFDYGAAPFYGSAADLALSVPIVGGAVNWSSGGYWLVEANGGIFYGVG